MMDNITTASLLSERIKDLGITRQAAAERAGMHASSLGRMLKGKSKMNAATREKLFAVLGLRDLELFTRLSSLSNEELMTRNNVCIAVLGMGALFEHSPVSAEEALACRAEILTRMEASKGPSDD